MDVGAIVLVTLLGAGAAYGLANRDKPKPALSSGKKRVAAICFGVAITCFLLALGVGLLPHTNAPH